MKLECQNCGMIADEDEFVPAQDIEQRHDMGDMFSDMECPDCGALAFPWLSDAQKTLVGGLPDEEEE